MPYLLVVSTHNTKIFIAQGPLCLADPNARAFRLHEIEYDCLVVCFCVSCGTYLSSPSLPMGRNLPYQTCSSEHSMQYRSASTASMHNDVVCAFVLSPTKRCSVEDTLARPSIAGAKMTRTLHSWREERHVDNSTEGIPYEDRFR